MPRFRRVLPLIVPLLLAACDSSSLYTADLGQGGAVAEVKAVNAAPPPGVTGEVLEFEAPAGGSLPSQWLAAQSVKVQLSGTFLPLASAGSGASRTFSATVPSTLGFVPPAGGSSQSMVFELDGDHVMVAEVSF